METKFEQMLSDIRDSSLSGMIKNKNKDRLAIANVLFIIGDFLFLLYLFPFVCAILNINIFIAKTLLFVTISGIAYYFVIDDFVLQRKKREKKKMDLVSKGGDMISFFMKIKEFTRKGFDLPYDITVIELSSKQLIPIEITYQKYQSYAGLLDIICSNSLTFQEFELRGKLSLFDRYRVLYPNFRERGSVLIKILESIFRENEKYYETSISRRLYLFLYIPLSRTLDIENILAEIITQSGCGFQFLNEKNFKDLAEQYFCCSVNLERLLKSKIIVKKISLDGTKLISKFQNEDDLNKFLKSYRHIKSKPGFGVYTQVKPEGGKSVGKRNSNIKLR